MLYDLKPMRVDAIRLQIQMVVNGKAGLPGDYLVTFADGSVKIMTGVVFENSFELPRIDTVFSTNKALAVPADIPPEPEVKPTGYVCIGCGSETVPSAEYDKNTGMCAKCLRKQVECQTCGRVVSQYEVIGTYCRRCLNKPA